VFVVWVANGGRVPLISGYLIAWAEGKLATTGSTIADSTRTAMVDGTFGGQIPLRANGSKIFAARRQRLPGRFFYSPVKKIGGYVSDFFI